jgi:hypothetical protein
MEQILHPKIQKLLQKYGHQAQFCLRCTPAYERVDRKSKQADMQWYKEEIVSATRKIQARLGR